ncbi:MAG: hypothetical protein ACYDC1_21240 [Limisphaerales bacterium]
MPTAHRHVRRLRLHAAREDHARHGRVLLEDALRTASLGDEGRWIVVRRLDLGRLSAHATATQWSRRLEDSLLKSGASSVRVHDRSAHDAAAVCFANPDEPWLLLARRSLAQQPCLEWYWRSAAPGWHPNLSVPDTLRLCVRHLAARGGLPLTLQLVATLPRSISLEPLLQSLDPVDLGPLAEALGFPLPPLEASSPAPAPSLTLPPSALAMTALERRFFCAWGPADLRTHWLAAVHLAASTPGRFSAFRPPPIGPDQIQQLVRIWRRETATRLPFPGDSRRDSSPSLNPPPPVPALGQSPPDSSPRSPREVIHDPDAGSDAAIERSFTAAGGLFFLLPLLHRSGLPGWIESLGAPERADVPWQILRLALRHSRIPANDPLVVAFRDLPADSRPLGRWLRAANRHALRLTASNLRQIVRRPARVTLAATHVDVFFRLDQADLRLRRAGLDLDPGWVSWLRRVVNFHYLAEDGP